MGVAEAVLFDVFWLTFTGPPPWADAPGDAQL
jgi:hypothetical protein